jgi:WD40 repeat protein
MADIFISHSGQDSETAAAIGERIRHDRPTWSLFYDKDNIRAGQRWQERLREELTSCRVVIALLSRNWLGSPWCFTEAVTATFRGKDVVGIETEDLTSDDLARVPPILHERQRVRLRDGDNRGWQEVLEALDRSGLDPDDWFPIPPNVGPYPGLVAFDEKDAGVFFGRKVEITEYLGILDTLRGPDRSQVLVISGGSGSGKSSLLRAGLIPRLRRKPEWVVISPFEVAREPVRNLLERLRVTLADLGIPADGLDLAKPPNDPRSLAPLLDETLWRLEQATGAWVLLPLDQAEALVAGDRPAGDPASLLLDSLAQVLGRRTRHAVVAATIRTEFVPRLEAIFAGPEVRLRQAPLSAIGSLAEIIEKPAERFGLELEPGLSERITEDVHTADALPLLAYTLKALNDRAGADRRLTLDGYRTLGGVQGAIAAKLESVLSDPEPTAAEVRALQRVFTRYLIRVDEGAVEGDRLLRRVVPRTSVPHSADRVIVRLVDAGLLVTKNGTIELAHERLIDDWPRLPLKTWLSQDATDRRLIDQLRQRVNDDALPDGLLAQAEELLPRDHELVVEEPGLSKLVQRSRDQRRARERQRRFLLGGTLLVALVVAVLAGFAWSQKNKVQIEHDKGRIPFLALRASKANTVATSPDDIERAGALALEGLRLAREIKQPAEPDAIEAARSALIRLPLVVLAQRSPVRSMAVLKDGRLASSGNDGNVKIWPKDFTDKPEVLSQGSQVLSLAALADGRLASGGNNGNITIWPKEGTGTPIVLKQGSPVLSLAALANGRLASGGNDGNVKIWPKDFTDKPEKVLAHGSPVSLLAALADERLASANSEDHNGTIKLWPNLDGTGEPKVLSQGSSVYSIAALEDGGLASGGYDAGVKLWTQEGTSDPPARPHTGSVLSLVALPDGQLASGGEDGTIRLWPKKGAPVILLQGSPVWSLAVLPDGRLATGGEDGNIKLWPKEGTGEPAVLLHDGGLAAFPDGRLASGGRDGDIKLWPKEGTGAPVVLPHGTQFWSLAVLPDGRLATGDTAGTINIWPKDGAGEPMILPQGSAVWSLAAFPDGRLASGGVDGNIRLWPQDGAGEPKILRQGSWVRSLAVWDDQLASGGDDGNIRLWPQDGAGEPKILQQGSAVWSLAVWAGRLASGGDGNIKIWSKDSTGQPVALLKQGATVRSLAILKDGRLASASGGEDGTIKIWPDLEGTGEPVIISHGSRIWSLAVLADGRLASAGEDGKIKLWSYDEQKLIAALCLRPGRNLTKDEWARYVDPDTPRQPSCRDRPSNWRTADP